jgi:hypothetical protein
MAFDTPARRGGTIITRMYAAAAGSASAPCLKAEQAEDCCKHRSDRSQ